MENVTYDVQRASEEAARCLLCIDAPCSAACPAGTDPANFIRAIRFRNIKGAAEIIREANVCAGSCAVICPAGKLCEGACLRGAIDRPIEIRQLQKFAVEQERLLAIQVLKPAPQKRSQKVACIGSGPASLACAARLAQEGIHVDIYETRAKAGGMLSYGVPEFRLPQEIVDFDIKSVTDLGVRIITGTRIGRDISLDEVRRRYQAVFLGCGLGKGVDLQIPGSDLPGVVNALDYLATAREQEEEMALNVIVIGAGDTAMDCAATALRSGAKNVSIVYRRKITQAPAYIEELAAVQKMGIAIFPEFQLAEILGQHHVEKIVARHRDGQSELTLAADRVITAIGQKRDDSLDDDLMSGWSDVRENFAVPGFPGVFAAGDVVNGGQTVVQAVKEGKLSATAIMAYLSGRE